MFTEQSVIVEISRYYSFSETYEEAKAKVKLAVDHSDVDSVYREMQDPRSRKTRHVRRHSSSPSRSGSSTESENEDNFAGEDNNSSSGRPASAYGRKEVSDTNNGPRIVQAAAPRTRQSTVVDRPPPPHPIAVDQVTPLQSSVVPPCHTPPSQSDSSVGPLRMQSSSDDGLLPMRSNSVDMPSATQSNSSCRANLVADGAAVAGCSTPVCAGPRVLRTPPSVLPYPLRRLQDVTRSPDRPEVSNPRRGTSIPTTPVSARRSSVVRQLPLTPALRRSPRHRPNPAPVNMDGPQMVRTASGGLNRPVEEPAAGRGPQVQQRGYTREELINMDETQRFLVTIALLAYPIHTMEDLLTSLINVCTFLEKSYLRRYGGNNGHDTTRRLIARLLSNTLAANLNWQGRGQKRGFGKLKVTDIIAELANENEAAYNEHAAVRSAARWLKEAPRRLDLERANL
ncbi:hypothetical protein QAD02_013524 [Eretmocerus hayati]|uniref:Uncharacterized protein n=3 Tax=Eretmocerus hayati TaxID=131215 RepID=A0ACC2P3Q6_9HYME|nr:hypothetical protein QAD02_013520 [Eretmocerus hayati]KAJ8677735.1 hypothetical protein QAD02_013522 [Eretmocerus hayati]KAJ8677737.1 hypothetical protein QAD02_013524 [Eretmocerus hayati]